MENTKKMLLIEPEVIEKLKSKENTNETYLSRLDKEMQHILKSKMDDREKWTLYMQVLQRYLYLKEEEKKIIKLPFTIDDDNDTVISNKNSVKVNKSTETKSEGKDEDVRRVISLYTPAYLNQLLPKSFKKKGELMVECLLRNKDKIYWNDDGTVVINHKVIPGSNISDLINDTLRELKRPRPKGWEQLAMVLKDIKLPLMCIGNKQTLQYINNLQSTELKNNFSDFGTPKSEKNEVGKLKKRKLNWDKWTPY